MSLNDVYQLTVHQELQGEEPENIFFFERLDPAGTADDLITAFEDTYLDPIRGVQSNQIITRRISCLNLGDLGDFADRVENLAGTAGAGDTMPAFAAVGYSLRLNTRAVRPGSKRFAGVLEAFVLNGVITDPGYLDLLEDLRVILDDVAVGALASYQPVVVKRIKTAKVGYTPPAYKYTLPKDGDPLVLGLVTQALLNPKLTSQVSRK